MPERVSTKTYEKRLQEERTRLEKETQHQARTSCLLEHYYVVILLDHGSIVRNKHLFSANNGTNSGTRW